MAPRKKNEDVLTPQQVISAVFEEAVYDLA
jgi:hypothetical protein